MDRGAWRSIVHRVAKIWTRLSDFTFFYSFSWRRKRQPAPVFLPEESHGQRGLVDCSLWGCKELDMTKQLTHTHTHTHTHTNNVGELIDAVILKTKTKKVKIIFMNKSLSINVKFTLKKKFLQIVCSSTNFPPNLKGFHVTGFIVFKV